MAPPPDSRKVGSVYVQLLSSASWDVPSPSLLLFCERDAAQSCLINCPEGTQRFCFEHKLRVSGKLRRLLLTRLTWDAVGGLPGLLLTLRDSGHGGGLLVHGPSPTSQLIRSFSHVVPPDILPPEQRDVRDSEELWLEESGISALPMVLNGSGTEEREDPSTREREIIDAPNCEGERGDPSTREGGGDDHSTSEGGREHPPTREGRGVYPFARQVKRDESSSQEASTYETCKEDLSLLQPSKRARTSKIHNGTSLEGEGNSSPDLDALACAGLQPGQSHGTVGQAVCWLIRMPPLPPKFSKEAAEALGVQGRLRGQLRGGQSVVLDNGVVVRPEQVLTGGGEGELLLIADCRAREHMEQLRGHHALQKSKVSAVIHLSPAHVSAGVEYVEWCCSMPSHVKHYFADFTPRSQRLAFVASARLQLKLHAMQRCLFPKPQELPTLYNCGLPPGLPSSSLALDMTSKVVLRPRDKAGIDRSGEARLLRWTDSSGRPCSLETSEVMEELAAMPQLSHLLCQLPRRLLDPPGSLQHSLRLRSDGGESALTEVGEEQRSVEVRRGPTHGVGWQASKAAHLYFLGTGAAIPSKYRNVSAILLQVGSAGSGRGGGLLLDAGEGSMGCLRRMFGVSTEAIISGLQIAWVSHIHADHHLGLLQLLQSRTALGCPPLLVVGPRALCSWLHAAAARLQAPVEYRFVHCAAAPHASAVSAALCRLGFRGLHVALADHCADAWAVGLSHEDFSLVYSGDTRPCDNVVSLAARVGSKKLVLIHEATFDDSPEMQKEAIQRRHSTVSEALGIGSRMGAWRVILTHFSQRYPKLADVRDLSTASAVIAFDGMQVPLSFLEDLPQLTPVLLCLFAAEVEGGEV